MLAGPFLVLTPSSLDKSMGQSQSQVKTDAPVLPLDPNNKFVTALNPKGIKPYVFFRGSKHLKSDSGH